MHQQHRTLLARALLLFFAARVLFLDEEAKRRRAQPLGERLTGIFSLFKQGTGFWILIIVGTFHGGEAVPIFVQRRAFVGPLASCGSHAVKVGVLKLDLGLPKTVEL